MTFEEKVELFFYSPNNTRDEFINLYKSLNHDRLIREDGRYRYSPLFILRKDIRYCFAFGREFNSCRKDIHPAEFAGIILLRICFTNLLKKFYYGHFETFARDWMGISDQNDLHALKLLRDALEHNFYSLFVYDKHTNKKIYFSLGGFPNIVKKAWSKNSPYESEMYEINHRMLLMTFDTSIEKLKDKILDPNETKLRNNFESNFDIDEWMVTGP